MILFIGLSLLIAFLVNIPLGMWRATLRKKTFLWWFAIHASIPLIIYLRRTWHISNWIIPVNIAVAILGQILGSRLFLKWRRNTFEI